MTDFSKVKFHPSQLGKLFVSPQSKADKEAGELSQTSKTYLVELYAQIKYGRKQELDNKFVRKGLVQEPESLLLLSEVLQQYLEKNEETFEDEILIGTPDCFLDDEETVVDVKSSYSIFSFLSNLDGKLDAAYELQLQAYMHLTGRNKALLAYCLVNNPTEEIEWQKQLILKKTNAISEESPEFKKEWEKKRLLYQFEDIAESERVLLFKVEKDPEFPIKCQQKVEKARLYLDELHKRHTNFNK